MLNLHLDPNPPPQAVVSVDFRRADTASANSQPHFVFLFQPTTPRAASMFARNTSRNWLDSRRSAS